MRECLFSELRPDGRIQCGTCPHGCVIADGKEGICRVRRNEHGKLLLTNYGRVSSIAVDPIEKKPLFHFYPGSVILSMGSLGCNFACDFCQNWAISQGEVPTRDISPECAVSLAREAEGNVGLAYTYNEPLMWYEYLLDTAPLIREAGMKNVLVTNGFINEEPLRRLLPYIDAMNIDVKSMRDDFYRRLCHGRLAPVLRAVEMAHAAGCWVELTCLVIPGENDRDDDFEALASWVANLSPDIPVHFSRYHPAYRLSQPATPTDTLERAYAVAREKLRYVYVGNVPGGTGENTRCPHCDKVVIERVGYSIQAQHLADGKCRFCGEAIAGIGST